MDRLADSWAGRIHIPQNLEEGKASDKVSWPDLWEEEKKTRRRGEGNKHLESWASADNLVRRRDKHRAMFQQVSSS